MSTATNKGSTGSTTSLSTADRIVANLPDDGPNLSATELIKLYELLIKGQLEESLPRQTIKEIRSAINDCEGMSLLIRAFEENSSLLKEMRVAIKKGFEQIIIVTFTL